MKYQLVVVALTFAVLRFTIPMPGLDLSIASLYKDMAHIFVGVMFGAAIVSTIAWGWKSVWVWILAAGLTLVEVAAFFILRR